jgi:hypothetical protein
VNAGRAALGAPNVQFPGLVDIIPTGATSSLAASRGGRRTGWRSHWRFSLAASISFDLTLGGVPEAGDDDEA